MSFFVYQRNFAKNPEVSKNKTHYRRFCQTEVDLPLFMQDWWLDIVCQQGTWDLCLNVDQSGKFKGVLPYYQTQKWGISMILLPPLTPYLGIWLRYPENEQKRERRYAFEKKEMSLLLQQLPKVAFCAHHHPIAVTNGLPFYWEGFQQSNCYTYRIDASSSPERVYAGMKSSVRNKIEKAKKSLEIIDTEALDQFYEINQKSFARQGKSMPYSLAFLQTLDRALAHRQQRKILIAQDREGQSHAAIYLVWDKSTLYNLALGGDTDLRKSGAIQLLLWRGIQMALEKGLAFDFEGSMIPSVENVFRDFGAEQVSYLRTEKAGNRFWQLLRALSR